MTSSYDPAYNELNVAVDTTTVALKSELFSGDYNDLTNKPTIPAAVSGTNDGTNWTTLTIGNATYGIGGGSAPSNMVTTDTVQTITGEKTFDGGLISSSLGGSYILSILGLGSFIYSDAHHQHQIAFELPVSKRGNSYTIATTDDIPTVPTNVSAFTNDAGYITGITSSMINTALGYTAADAADIPTTATSTVTPSTSSFVTSTTKTTETLTFTYTDNTTATITIVTGVTDNTSSAMTGATVSTTLS